jgi:holdfast attachment protein HfaA
MVNLLAQRLQALGHKPSERSDEMSPAVQAEPALGYDRKRLATMAFGLSATALAVAALLAAAPAQAQSRGGYANEFSRPYGINPGDETRPYDARTRDLNGNRVIINGRIVVGDDLSSLPLGLYNSDSGLGFSGTGTAIGNQLIVTTQGSFNTVIVNSTQVNNGDQTVVIGGTVQRPTACAAPNPCPTGAPELNGGLDF